MEDFEKIFFGADCILVLVVFATILSVISICVQEFLEAIRCKDLKNYKQYVSAAVGRIKRIYSDFGTKAWVIVAIIVAVIVTGNFFIDMYKATYEGTIPYNPVKFDAILELKGENSPEMMLPCIIELAGTDEQVYHIEDGELVADEGKTYYTVKANKLYLPYKKIIDGKAFYIDYDNCEEEDYRSVDGYKILADMPIYFEDNFCEGRIIIIRKSKGNVEKLKPSTLSSPTFLVGFRDSEVYHYVNCGKAKEGDFPLFFTDHDIAELFGYKLCENCMEKIGILHMEDYFEFYGKREVLQWIKF